MGRHLNGPPHFSDYYSVVSAVVSSFLEEIYQGEAGMVGRECED